MDSNYRGPSYQGQGNAILELSRDVTLTEFSLSQSALLIVNLDHTAWSDDHDPPTQPGTWQGGNEQYRHQLYPQSIPPRSHGGMADNWHVQSGWRKVLVASVFHLV